MIRLLWLAMFAKVMHDCLVRIGVRKVYEIANWNGVEQTAFAHFHDLAMDNVTRRVEQLRWSHAWRRND